LGSQNHPSRSPYPTWASQLIPYLPLLEDSDEGQKREDERRDFEIHEFHLNNFD
jgi:hypothetical protein